MFNGRSYLTFAHRSHPHSLARPFRYTLYRTTISDRTVDGETVPPSFILVSCRKECRLRVKKIYEGYIGRFSPKINYIVIGIHLDTTSPVQGYRRSVQSQADSFKKLTG